MAPGGSTLSHPVQTGQLNGLPDNVVVTKLDELASWCRKNSLWPMPFATACCGIELMATGASKHDLARFGAEVFRFSPRQCDLMVVAKRLQECFLELRATVRTSD